MARFFFYLVVVSHFALAVTNIIAFFILPFYTPWYVSIPLLSFLFNLIFNRKWECPLTELENSLRKKLGMRRIGGFVGHYFKKPIWTFMGWKKTQHINEKELCNEDCLERK